MTALKLHVLPADVAEALARGEHVDVMDEGRKVGEVVPGEPVDSRLRALRRRLEAAGLPVTPVAGRPNPGTGEGCMAGTSVLLGDIVAPSGDANDWEALRP